MPSPTFTKIGKPVTETDIAAVEAELGVRFPDQYRTFLLQINGGRPTPDCFDDYPVSMLCGIGMLGISDLTNYALLKWEMNLPKDVVAIGYGTFGFSICIGVRGNTRPQIYLYDHEFNTLKWLAKDFDTFLNGFHEPDLSGLEAEDNDDEREP